MTFNIERDCLWCEKEVDPDLGGDDAPTRVPAWPFYSLPAGWMHVGCEEEAQYQENEERALRLGKDGER